MKRGLKTIVFGSLFLSLYTAASLFTQWVMPNEAHAVRRISGGAQYIWDFTDGVPSTVACNRASGTVWPMQSPSSTAQNAAGTSCVYENRTGTSGDGGIWTWAAWSNALASPNDLVTGWSVSGSGLVTNNNVASPDGTVDAATLNKNQNTTFFANTHNITQQQPVAFSLWMKNESTPTDHGMNYWNGTGAVGTGCKNNSDPPPATWTRFFYWYGSMADTTNVTFTPLALAPAGLACGPSFTNTAMGALDYWGVQLANRVDYPLGAGSIANQTLNLNSDQLSRLVTLGDFEIDAFARVWTQELRAQPDGCIFGGISTDGELSVCYAGNANSATAATWTFKVAGVTVLTTQMGVPFYGGEVRVRAECRPSSNTSVLRVSIVGATEYSRIATGTCHGGIPLAVPTSFYLGSNNGASGFWPAMITRLVSYTRQQAYNRDEIVWLGDSISSWTEQTDANGNRLDDYGIVSGSTGSFSDVASDTASGSLATGGIYTIQASRNLVAHPGIAAVVTPGATCESIEANYITTPYFGSGFTHAIIVECGTNNINPAGGAQTPAQAATHYQHLVTTAKTANPSAAMICAYITPWAAQAANVAALNDCIGGGGGGQCAGAGGTPITGCDYIVSANFNNINSGGTCTQCTDNIHPNNIGRQEMSTGNTAGTYRGSLIAAGILSN